MTIYECFTDINFLLQDKLSSQHNALLRVPKSHYRILFFIEVLYYDQRIGLDGYWSISNQWYKKGKK